MSDVGRTILFGSAIESLRMKRDTVVQHYGCSPIPYVIPIIQRLDVTCPQTQAVIVSRTREYAIRAMCECTMFGENLSLTTHACVTGTPVLRTNVQVVCGTAGRFCDMLERGKWDISKVNLLVFDQFDDIKVVEAWREQLIYLVSKFPSVQISITGSNKEVLDLLVVLAKRKFHYINYCTPSVYKEPAPSSLPTPVLPST